MSCVWLLVLLQSMSAARAYEADIHYSTTYVLARAVGWSQPEARTIASANQGVDENESTVAALEMDAVQGLSLVASSLRQADRNLMFHCFSERRSHAGEIPDDVLKIMSGHFGEVADHDADLRKTATRMIALGVALHCQQDAYAHVDFGGACGAYAGSCYGHTRQTFFDQVLFRMVGKHFFNPDHPGVSGPRLLEALQVTARELAARRPRAGIRPVPTPSLVALSDALRESGLKLPDEVRMECNRHIAGKWLFDFFRSSGRVAGVPERLEKLEPAIAGTCRNASLASATSVAIPEPRFPRLNPDATPSLVRADGTYGVLRANDSRQEIRAAAIAHLVPDYKDKVQWSHWRQLLAWQPRQAALTSTDRRHAHGRGGDQ